MMASSLTPEELMEYWQSAFGDLDPKWHQQFLESEYVAKILKFSKDEIVEYLHNPPVIVEYIGIYHVRQERPAKKLNEIYLYLSEPKEAPQRAPLGTFTKRLEATGSDFGTDSLRGWSILQQINRIKNK